MLTIPQIIIIAGLLLVLSELFIGIQTGFDFVLIGTILILSGSIGMLSSNLLLTLIIGIILCFVYFFFGRKFIKKKIIYITHATNVDKLIGATGICIRSITPNTPGMIRLADEDWRSSANEVIYEKDKVKVVSIEGVTLKVIKIK